MAEAARVRPDDIVVGEEVVTMKVAVEKLESVAALDEVRIICWPKFMWFIRRASLTRKREWPNEPVPDRDCIYEGDAND